MPQKYHLFLSLASELIRLHMSKSPTGVRSPFTLLILFSWKAEGDTVVTLFILSQQESTYNSRGGKYCHFLDNDFMSKSFRSSLQEVKFISKKVSKLDLGLIPHIPDFLSSQPLIKCKKKIKIDAVYHLVPLTCSHIFV